MTDTDPLTDALQTARSVSVFDPGQHLSTIKGQDYLEVKWRLAWLRSEHPEANVETDLHTFEDDRAIFRARIVLPDTAGGGSATGWGTCTAGEFGNYLEKAETKALGRALAALGFGTQFAIEFDDGPETGMLADAPVTLRKPQAPQQRDTRGGSGGGADAMSPAQKGKILAMSREAGLSPSDLELMVKAATGTGLQNLAKKQASAVIDVLKDPVQVDQTLRAAKSLPEAPEVSGVRNAASNRSQGTPAPHRGTSTPATKPEGVARANEGQITAILRLGKKVGLSVEATLEHARSLSGEDIDGLEDLSTEAAGELIQDLQGGS